MSALFVDVTALAARQIREAEQWWRENRTAAPNAVRHQLDRAFTLIGSQPRIGAHATNVRLQGVRRIYLPIISYHLYYHVVSPPEHVEVVALWHSKRGTGPPI